MTEGISGFCMKCKHMRIISNPTNVKMSHGRIRVTGHCSGKNCDGKISKIIS